MAVTLLSQPRGGGGGLYSSRYTKSVNIEQIILNTVAGNARIPGSARHRRLCPSPVPIRRRRRRRATFPRPPRPFRVVAVSTSPAAPKISLRVFILFDFFSILSLSIHKKLRDFGYVTESSRHGPTIIMYPILLRGAIQ